MTLSTKILTGILNFSHGLTHPQKNISLLIHPEEFTTENLRTDLQKGRRG